jgi:asparagine N-glycosylation enzyme membrane subunit Stt3
MLDKEATMNIIQSASKIVFVLLAITSCVAFLLGRLEAKDFMVLTMAAFSFYFGINVPGNKEPKI